ncbi:hypothetical protein PR003_g17118 [Phytophthora rubi]|uniref:AWS domain-containing protein n=1 Tax=Phytophthora rubi TaxID=129364 RepID=A0A6A3JRA1_9STRA|nr:hypothetical protein PR001_g21064 [Phytophthora rubi]KAE8997640.1 hypothetical protein PR002_g18977 [Phytophthora rubi]KAE9322867.1 hypothetical protein PR003_g17118 [Phytophthora rubi]
MAVVANNIEAIANYKAIVANIGILVEVRADNGKCEYARDCDERCYNRLQQVECARGTCNLKGNCSNRRWSDGPAVELGVGAVTG